MITLWIILPRVSSLSGCASMKEKKTVRLQRILQVVATRSPDDTGWQEVPGGQKNNRNPPKNSSSSTRI